MAVCHLPVSRLAAGEPSRLWTRARRSDDPAARCGLNGCRITAKKKNQNAQPSKGPRKSSIAIEIGLHKQIYNRNAQWAMAPHLAIVQDLRCWVLLLFEAPALMIANKNFCPQARASSLFRGQHCAQAGSTSLASTSP